MLTSLAFCIFPAEWMRQENWCQPTVAMWQDRLGLSLSKQDSQLWKSATNAQLEVQLEVQFC